MINPRKTVVHFRCRIAFSVICFGLAVFLTDREMALPCLLAAAFHECGHLLFAKRLHIPISELKLDLFGARISVSPGLISYKEEFFLAAAGPLFSFLLSFVLDCPLLVHLGIDDFRFFVNLRESSLFLGILNLIPVKGFDGARMLSALLSSMLSPDFAEKVDRFLTGIFLILLWGISVYLLLMTGGGLSLFVFSLGLFFKVFLS